MLNEDLHLSDQELLLAADGELSARRAAQAHAHLASCGSCRARMAEIEETVADFARTHRQTLNGRLPPIAGSRALLRARLAVAASPRESSWWRRLFPISYFRFIPAPRTAMLWAAVLSAAVGGGLLFLHSALRVTKTAASLERTAVPNHRLTPGATRRVTVSDVCSMPHEEVIGEVSAPLRQAVFHEYGIANARTGDYEIDYLITPGLGGAEAIQNLWPEPYTSRTWNAHVKDTLEEHLHEMVCARQLDLATAQRDIATDWIAAYKNYFHTDRPLPTYAHLESMVIALHRHPTRRRRLPGRKLDFSFTVGA